MAKVRAYKLAEELGIDRNEFVEKAAVLGVELKSAMSALEPDQLELLREKLGSSKSSARFDEQRVERKGGAAVIRRRKKVVEPEPEPIPEPAAVVAAVAEPVEVAAVEEPEVAAEPAAPSDDGKPEADSGIAGQDSAPTDDARPQVARRAAAAPDAAPAGGTADRKGRQRKRVREVVNLAEQEQFARQVTGRRSPQRRAPVATSRGAVNPRARRRDAAPAKAAVAAATDQKRSIRVEGAITVGELAKALGVKAAQLQGKLMALGTMVSMNQNVDIETTRNLAGEMGFEVIDTGFKEDQFLGTSADEVKTVEAESAEDAQLRPAVITVMGHVDHGKTSILDALRKTNVVEGEAGGITQHIGAYQVEVGDSTLTFIDTPGHAAFTQMRARGAKVTDLVVLVVAATDGVMPQTIEAINHAKAAGCPIVVAVNKCDLPDANPQQTRQKLMEHDLIPEEFGGDIICVDVSAKTGAGLDQLLEMLALQAEVLELNAVPTRRASGVVLEARLDKGRGPVATVLISDGTLMRGDVVVVGTGFGRVRRMENDKGEAIKEAPPSTPVEVIGLSTVPAAGETFHAVENERVAKQIVSHRESQARSKPVAVQPAMSLDELFARAEGGGPKTLSIVLKADVQGTCEAVSDSLEKLSTDAVTLKVLSAGVGAVSENDVMLAKASDAIVIGFHVRPDPAARRQADVQGVEIRSYRVIMELLDEVRAAMAGLLPPTIKEVVLGQCEVRETFTIPKQGTIAGSYVTEGKLRRNAPCRLIRDGVQIYEGKLASLRRFKDDVREVQTGFECGVGLEAYNDVKIGDVIEAYELEEHAATL